MGLGTATHGTGTGKMETHLSSVKKISMNEKDIPLALYTWQSDRFEGIWIAAVLLGQGLSMR